MSAQDEADKLSAQGYRRVSNKYGLISRIDDPTWVPGNTARGDPDYYRRCLSKDVIEVPLAVANLIESSCHDSCGYLPKIKDEEE